MALSRVKRHNYVRAANAIHLSPEALRDFAEGRKALPVDKLQALALELFEGHIIYDPEIDRLRPARSESRPLCTAYPGPFDPKSSPTYTPVAPGAHMPGPQPVKKPQNVQKPKGRPGWLGGFL
jgi:hypothetical protein